MRVLVTGSSGQVGRAVVVALREVGHEVLEVSRKGTPSLDLTNRNFVADLVSWAGRCDGVIHAAAHLGMSLTDPLVSEVNGVGTQCVVEAALKLGAERLVYLSSIGVIGEPRQRPVLEDHPISPPTAYHASKYYGEQLVGLAHRGGVSTCSCRLTSPVGAGTPPGRIFSVFGERARAGQPLVLRGRGTRRQNYADVRDLAAGILGALTGAGAGVFNLGGGGTVSNRELAEVAIRAFGSPSRIEWSDDPDPADGQDWDISLDRAKREFGYAPVRSIEDSFRAWAEGLPG